MQYFMSTKTYLNISFRFTKQLSYSVYRRQMFRHLHSNGNVCHGAGAIVLISGFLLVVVVECKPAEVFPSGQAVVPDVELAAVPDM